MYRANTVKPLDFEAIDDAVASKKILVLDEHVSVGGIGESIASYILQSNKASDMKFFDICSVQDEFPDKVYNTKDLLERYGLTEEFISKKIIEMISR